MPTSKITEPMLLFSVAAVSRLMNVPEAAVRHAVRHRQIRTQMILIGDRIGLSIPLSAIAEYWNLPKARIQVIEEQASQGVLNPPVSIITSIIL